jgi:hypothetical protein
MTVALREARAKERKPKKKAPKPAGEASAQEQHQDLVDERIAAKRGGKAAALDFKGPTRIGLNDVVQAPPALTFGKAAVRTQVPLSQNQQDALKIERELAIQRYAMMRRNMNATT